MHSFSLINCLDDYTKDKRGDVGRVLREETMRTLAIMLPMVRNCSGMDRRVTEAICKIVQQSTEKIDATREAMFQKCCPSKNLWGYFVVVVAVEYFIDFSAPLWW